MSLNVAHEGYEYQDLLSAYFILENILHDVDCSFIIDKKEYDGDKFDDLTINYKHRIHKVQIKYSNYDNGHILEKNDLSASSGYELALDTLFTSWNSHPDKLQTTFRLCLAWNEPNDELRNILVPLDDSSFKSYQTRSFNINIDRLWEKNKQPLSSWRRFRKQSEHINRADFVEFCKHFIIETNFPKLSCDIYEPGDLEKIVLLQANDLGIGVFPNESWKKEEFVLAIVAIIRKMRSSNTLLNISDILYKLQINQTYGKIEQQFPIDESKNILNANHLNSFIRTLFEKKNVILTGEPGSGKSWFVNNLTESLHNQDITVIKHYCYIDINDALQKKRIQINTLYGNLIAEILAAYPSLRAVKNKKFASDLNELNNLIRSLEHQTVLIIDGLDHIDRVFNFHRYNDLSQDEIDIIHEISKITESVYLSLLVVTQPIKELDDIKRFVHYSIPTWGNNEIIELMQKMHISDIKINNDNKLSHVLFEKSNGNPLYLTYLIEELNKTTLCPQSLQSLPAYSFNLKNYYAYLFCKLNMRESTAIILSVVDFNLTLDELSEITGLGHQFVDESIDILRPILRFNYSSNGYSIYHESFRRFIVNYLDEAGVSLITTAFAPIISWFARQDFYTTPKAYRFYLNILLRTEKYNTISELIQPDFVRESLYAGQPYEIIKNNYNLLCIGAIKVQNITKIVILNELNKMIASSEDTLNSSVVLYYKAMGNIIGFDNVAKILLFEDKPSIPLKQGLKACYLLDEMGYTAPWNSYKSYFNENEKIDIEDFSEYLRLLLLQKNIKVLLYTFEQIKSNSLIEYQIEYQDVFRIELNNPAITEFRKEICAEFPEIEFFLLHSHEKNFEKIDLETTTEKILNMKFISDEENLIIKDFFCMIERSIADIDTITQIINRLKNKNWFYNWIIFYIKILQVISNNNITSDKVKSAYAMLILDTEPFKGKPRACDLYKCEKFIYDTFQKSFSLLQSQEDWKFVLNVLKKVSNDTSTSFQRAANGPLTTLKLFQLLSDNITMTNCALITSMLEEEFSKKNYDVYYYISDYAFYLSFVYSFAGDEQKAKKYFKEGTDNILAYGSHKDIAFDDVLNCMDDIKSIDQGFADEYIIKLYDLVESVVEHTDGKETRHYPNIWFEKFYVINKEKAQLYLLHELSNTQFDWRLEKDLEFVLKNNIENQNKNVINYLIQSQLINYDEYLLMASLDILELCQNDIDKKLLIVSIQNKLKALKNLNGHDKLVKKILNNSHSQCFADMLFNNNENQDNSSHIFNNKFKDTFGISRKLFSDMNLSDIHEYLIDNKIRSSELQSLKYFFDDYKDLTPKIKLILDCLVDKSNDYSDNNTDFTMVFNDNPSLQIYYLMSYFMNHRGGYYEPFTAVDKFVKAYKINPEQSMSMLFDLLQPKLRIGYTVDFTCNLLSALVTVGYDNNTIKQSWMAAYDILKSRLSHSNVYNWKYLDITTINSDLIFYYILFTRLKLGTVERFQQTIAFIAILLNREPQKLVDAIRWFFYNKSLFLDSVFISILELLKMHNSIDDHYKENFRAEITAIYPTSNFTIDFLIESLYGMNRKIVLFQKKSIVYPIDKETKDFFIGINNRHKLLDSCGIDLSNIFGKYRATFRENYGEYLELYYNRFFERMVNHIYCSNYIYELNNTELYDLFSACENKDDLYDIMKIDLQTIISQYFSSNMRSKHLKRPSEYETETLGIYNLPISQINDYIRIAHVEFENLEIEHNKLEICKIFGGIVFSSNKNEYPYSAVRVDMNTIWSDTNPGYGKQNSIIIFNFNDRYGMEKSKTLWLNQYIFDALGLHIDNCLNGFQALNSDNEVILKYNSWCTDYIAWNDYNSISNEIPRLDGAELLLREDYFNKISDYYSDLPLYKINIIKYH
jgi:hypothetical protein